MFVVIFFMMFFLVIFLFHTLYLVMTNPRLPTKKKQKKTEQKITVFKKTSENDALKRKYKPSLYDIKEAQSRLQTLYKKIKSQQTLYKKSQQKRIKNSKHISSNIQKLKTRVQKHQNNLPYLELIPTNREKCNFCS